MLIGFDLDGVFVDKPPLIPTSLIDWLYRGHQTNGPTYRIPSRIEQQFRSLSHFYLFRPQIKNNVAFVKNLSTNSSAYSLYLISSRFAFLQTPTKKLLKRYQLNNCFKKVIINIKDEQPHLFKEKMLKKLGVNLYIDDDLRLLGHLKKTCPKVMLLWYNRHSCLTPPIIDTIHNLSEIRRFISRQRNK